MAIELGQRAPDFTAPCGDGTQVQQFTLSQELGDKNIVLAFFPLAFTPVCTDELCEFRDHLAQLGQLDAKVLGISVDSPFTQKCLYQGQWFELQAGLRLQQGDH